MTATRARAWTALMLAGLVLGTGTLPAVDDQGQHGAAACAEETEAVAGMPTAELGLPGGKHLRVRVAATGADRAAGMQHLCAEAVDATAILFVFERPRRPHFHMNNVHAPLDIAFIAPDGRIVEVHRMTPDQETLTSPGEPVAAALEVAAGRGAAYGLAAGAVVEMPAGLPGRAGN
ncbi:DUF192 domain-containing protein [Aquisalimonas lutea]|uniref:DUF192 domain-containing protein n=1 Tax=Aquisalimonas lutea TaxID=1327750 RepID=UPI0025B4CC2C|nr:DUF192 domain-containing protein [Aquisalimonas lutea]MDN3518535.1 DUF192 domain-containing protein [Aquisalimonas lutea]